MKQINLNPVKVAYFIAFFAISFLFGCSKNKSTPIPKNSLAISSLSVSAGSYNTSVIITGTGFDATAANDKVYFNGKAATVTAATATQITVTVPLGAGTGPITVSINGGAPISGPIFTYQLSWIVSTVAGTGSPGNKNAVGTAASFNGPFGIAVDKNGNLYLADRNNIQIRKITPDGTVSTIATSAELEAGGIYGPDIYHPYGVLIDNLGNIFVTEDTDGTIRKIDATGVMTIFAGDEKKTGIYQNGVGTSAYFLDPSGMTLDNSGNIYVTEYTQQTIRKITPTGVVTAVAGIPLKNGSANGIASSATFTVPTGVAVDAVGNLYIADQGNHLIRKITPGGTVSTFAGDGTAGYNNGPGSSASFNYIDQLVIDKDGNLYVTDTNVIRKIDPNGVVSIFAGQISTHGSADGPAAEATFFDCHGIAIDQSGNLYVTEYSNNLVRKISLQ